MDPLQEIREALSVYGKVSFDPIIRKLTEVDRVVKPDPQEDLTPKQCIRGLRKFEETCRRASSEGRALVDSLKGGYDDDIAGNIMGLMDDFDSVALEEYGSDPGNGLMYSLALQFGEVRDELSRQYDRAEKALWAFGEELP
jgi:hypothetical protein